MTTTARTRRPSLVIAFRAIAALTVVGSAAAVTTLALRSDDPAAVESSTAAALSTALVAAETPPATAGAGTESGADASVAPGAAVPGATVPGQGAPIAGAVPAGAPAPDAAVPLGGPNASVPLGQSTSPATETALGEGTGLNGSVPLGAASPFATTTVNTQPACPLGWPAPKQQGGLASLIGLAPLAGPFSSEAFALGAVYQPVLQLAGPVLAEIAPLITRNQPLIDPIIARVQAVEAVVLEAILPYYGPYRGQLIAAEGDFAKALAPVLNSVYNSEAASCFVAWQGQIIDQAKGGRITVASLAHPGTVVELGPQE
ncbi:hypothetical protein [Nocardia huaxiensis]|uniref:Uncharacterized protein n=1 Tax=Nocardia huaxiensis TaxID=2755382 RepID=A0A7D6V9Q7_9NOCA|nr:hypothetical protein [Nocardia huaxiensis]QLY30154.1 hypothetical protein H0264_34145 [Nocardia huaxiensis]UFS96233.1 hypothetical protein LPY97_37305 [Nocardia huaxiensis]